MPALVVECNSSLVFNPNVFSQANGRILNYGPCMVGRRDDGAERQEFNPLTPAPLQTSSLTCPVRSCLSTLPSTPHFFSNLVHLPVAASFPPDGPRDQSPLNIRTNAAAARHAQRSKPKKMTQNATGLERRPVLRVSTEPVEVGECVKFSIPIPITSLYPDSQGEMRAEGRAALHSLWYSSNSLETGPSPAWPQQRQISRPKYILNSKTPARH